MRYLVTVILLNLIPFIAFSQCDSTMWAKEGTYELIKIQTSTEADLSATSIFLTQEQLCLIEASRKNNHFVYLDLDLYTRVKIYPKYTSIKIKEN